MAFRLLEDYGNVKPGDTIIQNSADLPVGQAVIQLCKMLKIRTINLVPDDPSFARTKELLMGLGATLVLKDNTNVVAFLKDLGSEMPRLAIDALGGEARDGEKKPKADRIAVPAKEESSGLDLMNLSEVAESLVSDKSALLELSLIHISEPTRRS